MDSPVEAEKIAPETKETTAAPEPEHPYRSGHLMCRSNGWGIMGFLACAYFAWLSFSHVWRSEYDWPHDTWTAATYIIWIIVLVGLMLDTRCWREQLFFGMLVTNFVIGFGLTIWRTIPATSVRTARLGTGALWTLAALISLSTMRRSKVASRSN